MQRKVAIVAVAQTKYEDHSKAGWKYNWEELLYQTVKPVLDETGLTFTKDGTGIDGSVTCHDAVWVGSPFSSGKTDDVLGTHLRPGKKIEGDGSMGVTEALWQIASGDYDVVIVGGVNIESAAPRNKMENYCFDHYFQRLMGLDMTSAAALQATSYMHRYNITPQQCAEVVVKSRKNAKNNPYAFSSAELSSKEVLESDMVADPITALGVKPTVDGACTILLASEEKARKLTDKPIWITGVKNCYDSYHLGGRDLSVSKSLEVAAQGAYQMAGISNPLDDIDVAEIGVDFGYQELLWSEELGFCGQGEGGKLLDSGATGLGGGIPINPSGGPLAGSPYVVEGMAGIANAVLQLRGEAGKMQVPGAKVALAHGTYGACGQWHQVMILEN
ncbi:MAG: thiolase family protein [Proteobacteria bacterium]|nr:thiolase family protein [Pseudomonadota bacterium]